uniref:GDT1 family protein n=1 Tax=Oryza rufipogon TaxID=4529 RepID=A0A0E0R899_ORYRU
MDPNPRLLILLVLLAFSATVAVAEDGESTGGSKVSLGRRAGGFLHGLKKEAVVEGDHGVALDEVGPGLFDALFASLSMILVSEIGDETFIIAALMAMRHPKSIVLSGALSALYVMTVLSTGLGRIVPNLISRKHTNSAATAGIGLPMRTQNLHTCNEILEERTDFWCCGISATLVLLIVKGKKEITTKLLHELHDQLTACAIPHIPIMACDTTGCACHDQDVEEKLESGQGKSTLRRFFGRFCTPIFLEAFILTFLAEWGDRSQIATIALATHKNAIGVAVGASLGHTVCTSLAVIGGSMLASKISQRTVATIGGVLFLGFSVSSYFYPPL